MGFSWADEVEREEQDELERAKRKHNREEEEKQLPKRRADPFGAARPREVVLEEKGVDWRKIDLDLEACSNRRSAASSSKKDHPRKKSHKQQNVEEIVPPLRYPPKNTANLMERIHMVQPDTRNSAASNARFRQNLPINSAQSLKRVSQGNVRTLELDRMRMNPNIGTLNPRHETGSNCKRKYAAATFTDEMENNQAVVNWRKSSREGTKRAILSDLNMERTNPRKNKRPGDDAPAKRNSDFLDLMCQSTEPKMLLPQNYRLRRTEPSNQGNSTGNMFSGKDSDSKSKVLSSQTRSGHRRRRRRNQATK